MQPSTGVKTWQWVVTVIVIIVLIIIGVMVLGNKSSDISDIIDDTTPSTDDSAASMETNRVVISDQFPGNVVYVSSVNLANGGFVEIHKDNAGSPGAYIGSMYFPVGISPGGKITLTSPTVEGGIYYAMIHSDDGDKIFDPTKDLPMKDSKGNIIMKLFRASAAAATGVKG